MVGCNDVVYKHGQTMPFQLPIGIVIKEEVEVQHTRYQISDILDGAIAYMGLQAYTHGQTMPFQLALPIAIVIRRG